MRALRESIFCCICVAEFAFLIMGAMIQDSSQYKSIVDKNPQYYGDFDSFFVTIVWLPFYLAMSIFFLILCVICLYVNLLRNSRAGGAAARVARIPIVNDAL